MTSGSTPLAPLAIAMARELPYLRPSQQRHLSHLLETPEQLAVFSKAIELALQAVAGDSDEITERVYLLGREVRQIFDGRGARHLGLTGQWEGIAPSVVNAFACGFNRMPFTECLDLVRATRVRQSKRNVSMREGTGIDAGEISPLAATEVAGRMVT